MTVLSDRFTDAFQYAFQLHHVQRRKGSDIPYMAHLMEVTAIVLEDGGDEDQAIAALLHDAVEDQGGLPTLEMIRERFGERVAVIVASCSDTYESPKPAWKLRKERYLDHIPSQSAEVLLVSLADKVHNARTILTALKRQGIEVFERFNGGKDGTLWYYRSLCSQFKGLVDPTRLEELEQLVSEIEKFARRFSG